MESSNNEKRFLKIFKADSWEKVIQKINSFSESSNVKILNYQTDIFRDEEKTILVFYSKTIENETNDTE